MSKKACALLFGPLDFPELGLELDRGRASIARNSGLPICELVLGLLPDPAEQQRFSRLDAELRRDPELLCGLVPCIEAPVVVENRGEGGLELEHDLGNISGEGGYPVLSDQELNFELCLDPDQVLALAELDIELRMDPALLGCLSL